MSFISRPRGITLRRMEDAFVRPHDPKERFDPDFPVAMRCNRCGEFQFTPRALMSEAMREHMTSECKARHTKADAPMEMMILHPRT